jgi:YidC/Oxa1 family membrane protein insertase
MTTILKPLTDLLLTIMTFVHDTFGLNWGWSIVVLTIIVRIILIPLTFKQFKSMRAMQVLQPQLKEIQEKYKSDKQLMQQKVMEFYKENKVSPFGSCLPLVLQMPVFFSLFYMLQAAAKTGGVFAGETWLWIGAFPNAPAFLQIAADITKFDLPLLILYVGSQFLSSAMMSTGDQTQKMIMYVMPIGIGIIMYIGKWPAGLFIYWFTSNMWTIGQQYLIKRTTKMPPPPAVVASTGGKSGAGKQQKALRAKGSKS